VDDLIDGPRGPIGVSLNGSGPRLVLVAGLGATRKLWGAFPEILGRDFRVLSFDNPGVGDSKRDGVFSIDEAAADLLHAAWTFFGGAPFAVLGASLGGIIAARAAMAAPESISRLVVISSPARLTRHGRRSIGMLRSMLEYFPPSEFGTCLMNLAFAPPSHETMPGFIDEAAVLFGPDPADISGARAQADELLRGWDDRNRLKKLMVPSLVLAGERDPIVAFEDTREIAECLPNSTFVGLGEAAHSVLAEGGLEILQRLRSFLKAEALPEAESS